MLMQNNAEAKEFELLCVIVNYDMGSKVIKTAKQNGIFGGTIFHGRGTVNNCILEFLELCDTRKEIAIMLSEKNTGYKVLDELNKKFNFSKPHHGVAFSIPVIDILGSRNCNCPIDKEKRGEISTMYNAIFVIVDKGNAEAAVEAATKAGSKGGTIINARGSGIHETSKLFSMEIEPEKEIVLIISEAHLTDSIISSIKEQLKIDVPGNGIIFVQDINKTYGIY